MYKKYKINRATFLLHEYFYEINFYKNLIIFNFINKFKNSIFIDIYTKHIKYILTIKNRATNRAIFYKFMRQIVRFFYFINKI